jgi:protein tyrosine/serine phosphatase
VKNRIDKLSAAFVALVLLAHMGMAQEPRYAELPNFHKVNEYLYRGAQPRSGGIKKLAELGIKTIVNLRGTCERTRAEESEAMAAGLHYFNIPMPRFARPSDNQVARVMAVIDAQENRPVFIHCKRGSDRTGTMVAIYRILREGWSQDRALAEAKRYGMSWIEFRMRNYIRQIHTKQRPSCAGEKPPSLKLFCGSSLILMPSDGFCHRPALTSPWRPVCKSG